MRIFDVEFDFTDLSDELLLSIAINGKINDKQCIRLLRVGGDAVSEAIALRENLDFAVKQEIVNGKYSYTTLINLAKRTDLPVSLQEVLIKRGDEMPILLEIMKTNPAFEMVSEERKMIKIFEDGADALVAYLNNSENIISMHATMDNVEYVDLNIVLFNQPELEIGLDVNVSYDIGEACAVASLSHAWEGSEQIKTVALNQSQVESLNVNSDEWNKAVQTNAQPYEPSR